MVIDQHLHVRCINPQCPNPADTHVPVAEVAPKVIAWPTLLRCRSCTHPVMEVRDDAKQV